MMETPMERGLLGKAPKNFLLPYILLILREVPVHGYELVQKLAVFGFQDVDRGNVYRILRQLEKDHYVQSEWNTKTAGPAKRLYSLTDAGEAYLRLYAAELERYQSMLDQFFRTYSSILNLYNPFLGVSGGPLTDPANSTKTGRSHHDPGHPESKETRENDLPE
ncbi:poly-beta-hydroxybutyrate-responsive repressor [Kyrpidia sp.]|uniref:poly-beta-hydroxybutyrate-responsive repressor n=1 Tax=Kyrpidia sp. TaxID=2073077 RepID=UPI002583459E|nr:poly-beta-hydroxybutyrate-responsive repressor [Kyrpidia sp.]